MKRKTNNKTIVKKIKNSIEKSLNNLSDICMAEKNIHQKINETDIDVRNFFDFNYSAVRNLFKSYYKEGFKEGYKTAMENTKKFNMEN